MKNIKLTPTKKNREIDMFGVTIHDSDRERAHRKMEDIEALYMQIHFDSLSIVTNEGAILQLQPTTNGFWYYILRKTVAGTKNCFPASCFLATYDKKVATIIMLRHALQSFDGVSEMYGSLKWGAENCMEEALREHRSYLESSKYAQLQESAT